MIVLVDVLSSGSRLMIIEGLVGPNVVSFGSKEPFSFDLCIS